MITLAHELFRFFTLFRKLHQKLLQLFSKFDSILINKHYLLHIVEDSFTPPSASS